MLPPIHVAATFSGGKREHRVVDHHTGGRADRETDG
jgi:hypothetical protein